MMSRIPKVVRYIIRGVLILAVVFILVTGLIAYFVKSKEPPAVQDAPWLINTSSRVYYARELSILPDGNPKIKGYWELDNGRYRYYDSIFDFPRELFGSVDIIRRPKE